MEKQQAAIEILLASFISTVKSSRSVLVTLSISSTCISTNKLGRDSLNQEQTVIKKTWSQFCYPFHALRPSHARLVETSNAENPTPDEYITKYIVTKWGVLVALFLTNHLKFAKFQRVKTKASRKRLCQYVCLIT